MNRQQITSANLNTTLLALADPIRRKILERLSTGEARVTDIASAFPISLNSVSKHIRVLERARLVERRVIGREHLMRLRFEPLDAAQNWIAQQRKFWARRLQAMDDLLVAEDASTTTKKEKKKK